jgi:hypothetical protein
MVKALDHCKQVISQASGYLMEAENNNSMSMRVDEQHFADRIPEKSVVPTGEGAENNE